MNGKLIQRDGEGFPPGATAGDAGVNFSVFSRSATRAWLQLYRGDSDPRPFAVFELDPDRNRTFFFWHVFVEGLAAGCWYTWRMDGPRDTSQTGCMFDQAVELLDPRAREVGMATWDRERAVAERRGAIAVRARVLPADDYDWECDRPLQRPAEDSVIYELHVGGFTRHPSSQVRYPGTFSGLIERIPYLASLGITDVELMPVMAFDPQDVPPGPAALGLTNYWGYSPVAFHAPHPGYAAQGEARRELRDLVKALHRADIGVIIDVVFNHTAEGGRDGPVIGFKGIGNEFYYHLDPADRSRYVDYSGCGNTLNCNHPAVTKLLLQCLEYWVRELHVDGFRFDLASVMGRGEDGEPMYHAPLLWSIEFSETLAHTRLIGEAWDAAGLYQVGDFPGYRWAEWNGQYRDTIRRFVRGDRGLRGEVAMRLSGSNDLYEAAGKLPINSINYVTCHDGFTLADLVSYAEKHNQANGEDNRDGAGENFSDNCGHEGPTGDPAIQALRARQARNLVAILLLSQGTPMLLSGDEMLRTQQGNNNAYCQDNELGWLDWSLLEHNADMQRFTVELIALRRRHRALRRRRFLNGVDRNAGDAPDVRWFDESGEPPDWHDADGRTLGFRLAGVDAEEPDLLILMNMSEAPVDFVLPSYAWRRTVDTGRAPPADVTPAGARVEGRIYRVTDRAVVVLEG